MEKSLSLTHEEATALLEMSLFTYLDDGDEAANTALGKLGDLCREFATGGDRLPQPCGTESVPR